MKILILLVVTVGTVVVNGDDPVQKVADQITTDEEQCNNLLKLKNDHAWYTPLSDRCEKVLLLEKHAYISSTQLKMDDYKDHDDKFPITGSKGEVWVRKPAEMSEEEIKTASANFNIEESDDVKEIVALQIQYDLNDSKPGEELKKLNCLKDMYMKKKYYSMNDFPDTFPVTFKGVEVNFPSPTNVDSAEVCKTLVGDREQAQVTPAKEENKEEGKQKQGGQEEGGHNDEDFSDLDKLAEQTQKVVKKPSKIVTKSVSDDLIGSASTALISAATKGLLGGGGNSGNGNGGIMSGLASSLVQGALTGNSGSKGGGLLGGSPLGALGAAAIPNLVQVAGNYFINQSGKNGKKGDPSMMPLGPQHITTIMKLANNVLKRKEDREIISKAEAKAAIEVVTKTALHFFILTIKARQSISDGKNLDRGKKLKLQFVNNLEIAVIDALASSVITYIVDMLIPDDEVPAASAAVPEAEEPPQSADNGIFGSIFSSIANANNNAAATAPNNKKRKV